MKIIRNVDELMIITKKITLMSFLSESTKLRALRAHVPTCLVCLPAPVSCAFGIFALSFSCEIKLYLKSPREAGVSLDFYFYLYCELSCTFRHISHQAITFNGCYETFCIIKWFDFCLSRTFRVIFEWSINGGKWVITGRS